MSAASSTGSADGTTGLSAMELGEAATTGDWSAIFNRAVPDAESSGIYYSRQAREQNPTYQARVASVGAALAQRFNEVTGAPVADVTISTVSSHPAGRRHQERSTHHQRPAHHQRQTPQERVPTPPVNPAFEEFLKKYQEAYGGDSTEGSQDSTRASVVSGPSVKQAPENIARSSSSSRASARQASDEILHNIARPTTRPRVAGEDASKNLSRSSLTSRASARLASDKIIRNICRPAAPSRAPAEDASQNLSATSVSRVPGKHALDNNTRSSVSSHTSTKGPSATRSGKDTTEPTSSISLTDFRHLHALMDGSLDFKFLETGRICFTKPRPPFHAYLKDCGNHENDDSVFSTSTTNDEKQILVTMAKIRDEVRTLFDHDTMLHAEATKLHEEIARLAAEINHLKSTRKRADSGVASDSDRSSKNVRVLEQELGELRVRHDQESKKTSVLEQQIGDLQIRYDLERNKTASLEKQLSALRKQNAAIQTRQNQDSKETNGLEQHVSELNQHIADLDKHIDELETLHEQECQKTKMLEKQVDTLQEQNITIQTLHEKECRKTHDLQKQIGVLQEQNITIQTLHKEERRKAIDLQKQIGVLKEQNVDIQAHQQQACKKNHELQKQVSSLQEQNADIHTHHQQACKKTHELQKQVSSLQENNADIQTRHDHECKKASALEKQVDSLEQYARKAATASAATTKAPTTAPTAASKATTTPAITSNVTATMPAATSNATATMPAATSKAPATMPTAASTATAPTSTTSRTTTSSASRVTTSTTSKTTTTRSTSRVASASSSASSYSSARSGSRAAGVGDTEKIRVSIRRPAPLSRETQDHEDDITIDPRESADKNVAIVFRQVSREAKEASDRLVELISEQSQNDPSVSKRRGDALAREIKNVSELYQMKRRQVYRLRQTYSGLEKLGAVSDMNDFDITVDSLGGI
ncbi:hypothetical protein RB595_003284 [Gaeumannomyces hyphopodioides]